MTEPHMTSARWAACFLLEHWREGLFALFLILAGVLA
jgi:hypothetical protein